MFIGGRESLNKIKVILLIDDTLLLAQKKQLKVIAYVGNLVDYVLIYRLFSHKSTHVRVVYTLFIRNMHNVDNNMIIYGSLSLAPITSRPPV